MNDYTLYKDIIIMHLMLQDLSFLKRQHPLPMKSNSAASNGKQILVQGAVYFLPA